MSKNISLNNGWYYSPQYEEGMEKSHCLTEFAAVNLPHTNIELPYNYFDEKTFQFVSCYKYPLKAAQELRNKILYIQFEGVMTYARVYLNGTLLGEHKGGYTPFSFRIDNDLDWGSEINILTVIVDSTERSDIPPFGGQIDYLTYGGIYREVSLCVYDKVFIKNVKIENTNVLEECKCIDLKLFIENVYCESKNADITVCIKEKLGEVIHSYNFNVFIDEQQMSPCFKMENLKGIKLWDIDNPVLYELSVTLETNDTTDTYIETFAFRSAQFTPEGFLLNGKKLKLRGINRHQSFPYVGYAMPKRIQEKDAEIIKNELHFNLVRTSHYPQSKHFLNKCDELGLLVLEEIPGWQHIGNEEWKEVTKLNVKDMILRDWNHPSIIMWGVRINESQDDDEFYFATNSIARELDSTRQTGGIRFITNSNLIEDVYTMNDFNHDGVQKPLRTQMEVTGLDHNVPYLVTEFNGHMYPTKRFDQEERQMEHCLRHLRVQDAAYLDPNISGAIGWCAFDYNTHKDFGSGDGICYHGIMDMYRIPKFASYVYKSQVSPESEIVLEPITFWARGERSIGGIIPLVVFTNCDYIDVQYGDFFTLKEQYPRRDLYKGIPNPPVVIDSSQIKLEDMDAWGMSWHEGVIKGYYKGELVIERKLSNNHTPSELQVYSDDSVLHSYEKDATRVVVKIVDEAGNLLPFFDEIVQIKVSGPCRLIGPSQLVLKGGAIAFWVETINEPGKVDVSVVSQRLGEKNITLYVK